MFITINPEDEYKKIKELDKFIYYQNCTKDAYLINSVDFFDNLRFSEKKPNLSDELKELLPNCKKINLLNYNKIERLKKIKFEENERFEFQSVLSNQICSPSSLEMYINFLLDIVKIKPTVIYF